MSNPKVSIGIPVYNDTTHIAACIESLLGQTLSEIEILVVDDCSTDNTFEVINNIAKSDPRVRVFKHDQNKHAGGARNTAIRNAQGDFMGFVDSDDWVAPEMFERMYEKAVARNVDIVVCGTKYTDYEGEALPRENSYPAEILLEGRSAFEAYLDLKDLLLMNASWDKLYRRSLFSENNIYYTENAFWEDFSMTARLLFMSRSTLLIPEIYYFYRQRPGSLVATFSSRHSEGASCQSQEVKKFLIEQNVYEEYKERFWVHFYRSRFTYFYTQMLSKNTSAENYLRYFLEWCHGLYEELDEEELSFLSAILNKNEDLRYPYLVFPQGVVIDSFGGVPKQMSDYFVSLVENAGG